ncbi:MAG TPA: O-antigen ligase family protein [Kofleriaceae bacterium]|nr:O-antigen ligase family protein [Kofleriaceae bacterium]
MRALRDLILEGSSRSAALILGMLLVVSPLAYVPIGVDGVDALMSPKIFTLKISALSLGVLVLIASRSVRVRDLSHPELWLLFGTIGWLALAVGVSPDRHVGRPVLLDGLYFALTYAAVAALPGSGRIVLRALVVLGTILGTVIVLQERGYLVPGLRPFDGWVPPAGTFVHRNPAAYALAAALVATVPMIVGARRRWSVLGLTLAGSMVALGLIYARSRGAWIAAGAGLGVLLALQPRALLNLGRLHALALVVVIAGHAAATWPPSAPVSSGGEASESVASRLEDAGSLRARFDLWRVGGTMIADSPLFGLGPGRYEAEAPPLVPHIRADLVCHAHNDVINLAVDAGLPAVALFVAFVLIVLVRGLRRTRRDQRRWPPTLLGVVVVFLVMSSMEVVLRTSPLNVMCAASLAGLSTGIEAPPRRDGPRWVVVVIVGGVALLCALAVAAGPLRRSLAGM